LSSDPTAIGLTFVVYLVAMLLIGVVAYRRTLDLSDYILGGRRLGSGVAALSAQASDMSGWLLLGLPGYAYLAGLESVWLAGGLLLGIYLNWKLVATRLRRYTLAAENALTLSDYLERRFADRSHLLRIVSACFILLFFLFYTSSGLVAGGKLFNAVFGLPYVTAVLAGAGVVVAYTFLGGFLAVAWTDAVQGLMMLGALIIVPVVAAEALGGWSASLARVDPALLDPWVSAGGQTLTGIGLVSLLGWGLGYFGQPHILVRFMAVRSEGDIPVARRIAMIWSTATLTGAVLVGLVGNGYLGPGLADADAEKVFIRLVGVLFHPALAGIWLSAILAAIMSTADSQLLVASSALADDFYLGLVRKRASQRELVWVGRMAVAGIAVIAVLLALDPDSRVLDLVAYAWAGLGAAFGPTLLSSLFWKRMSAAGALAGILVGGITVIVWRQLSGGLFELYEMVPGVLFSALAIVVTSLLGTAPPEGVQRQFEAVTRGR
jgi:sodium/proline symporter